MSSDQQRDTAAVVDCVAFTANVKISPGFISIPKSVVSKNALPLDATIESNIC